MRQRSLVISLSLHAAAFIGLMYIPPFGMPVVSPSEYQQGFAGKEDKIVWYRFHQLPDIAPPNASRADRPLRAEAKANEAVVSSSKDAPKRDQVIVASLPPDELPPLDLPNLIAVKLPPKDFTTPPDLVKPGPPEIKPPEAPENSLPALDSAKLLKADRLPSKPYIPPALPKTPEPRKILEVAEAIPAPLLQPTPQPLLSAGKLPSRAYVPPPSPPPPVHPKIDAPNSEASIAIATLKPSSIAVRLPDAASPAQFSAGQTIHPDGATSDGADKYLVVSDLYAHPAGQTKPDLLATTVVPKLPDHLAPAPPRSSAPVPPGATRVSSAPDRRFNGRDIYMMAIQMPNLTSYSGSWLMWYTEHAPRGSAQTIIPPVPHRKVDPKYSPAMQQDRAQGKVQLFCVVGTDGVVRSIELVNGADERLNQSAEEALAKWEFYPATRNGEPVDVDVVVEIPFVLAPPPLK
jgi:TonB family protein